MDEHSLVMKIAEIRSYIASDWPNVEELKTLYASIKEIEKTLQRIREEARGETK